MKNIKLYELSKIEHLGQMKKIIDDGFDINAIIRGYTALSWSQINKGTKADIGI